ncbi:hypothetical protein B0H17DRAFT_1098221 [Mycena rosella]|uniref:MARVEL domain-containing protein n=1 Tax=Mycena rosella TaxID=1033263 RepID=A0AAD7CPP0_MYCRO|nr:hypothetical protein B0H17DRAFT_1103574 [Mycena rosella]KAJ7656650.1 hypothetical protein B0H17DRAFT_1098221 [Mycena rosella]
MALIPLLRIIALSVVLGFAVIVLGLSAALTSTTETILDGFFEFAALAIATASLTLITLPIMIILEYMRPGQAFTSMIVVELSWLSILWVLWLATAADSAQAGQLTFISGCGYIDSTVESACRETSAIQAFSFLNWIILMAYTVLILVLSIIASARKHTGVWRASVADAPFFTPGAAPAIPPVTSQHAATPSGTYGGGYTTQPYTAQPITQHTTGGTTGPASVQAGTVHQSV